MDRRDRLSIEYKKVGKKFSTGRGRYPYLLCFHVSKACYPHPPPKNPVIPDLYLAGIKLANLFRNYLNMKIDRKVNPVYHNYVVIYYDLAVSQEFLSKFVVQWILFPSGPLQIITFSTQSPPVIPFQPVTYQPSIKSSPTCVTCFSPHA